MPLKTGWVDEFGMGEFIGFRCQVFSSAAVCLSPMADYLKKNSEKRTDCLAANEITNNRFFEPI